MIFGSDGSGQPGTGVSWDNVQVTGATTDAVCLGCIDAGACNYDADATYDDASCEYLTCAGCIDAGACNYDSDATIDDGSCDFSCLGCTDMAACNYDDTATIDDGSCNLGTCGDGNCDIACGEDTSGCADCVGIVPGCTDMAACNYDAAATIDDGSCDFTSCAGCMDVNACNYDVLATIDDGSCILGTCGNGICEAVCGETVDNCNDCAIRFGCTDTGAHNYSPRATDDDGSCETCSDGILNGDEIAVDCGGALCVPCLAGCMDVDAHNYDDTAQVDDGSCETCGDGMMNGDETGVDCGGSNANCGPCGDLCINALDIACGDLVSGDTNDNTGDDVPAICGGVNSPDAGAWYTFTGTGENVVLSTDHSGTNGFDTNLQVYEGSCGALTCVDGDEDGGDIFTSGWTSELTITSTPGTNYYVYVGGFDGDQGAYELSMDCFFPLNITLDAIHSVPASGIGTGSVGVTVTGGNTDCGPLVYDWTGPDGYTASTADISDITVVGEYTLIVTDCLGNEDIIIVDVPLQTRGRRRKAAEIVTSQLQAAPNPFANLTTISFEVNTEEKVSLDVFDIRGAKVATLFDETTEAGQSYQVQFGEAMPSGTYIAKLTTSNGQVQHIKLFLTK
ncbi:MAG: T9SS type A sorting domain-containing protein [Chitinophagales bacterium]